MLSTRVIVLLVLLVLAGLVVGGTGKTEMFSDDDKVREMQRTSGIPETHVTYLRYLKDEHGFEPAVCYDVGANVMAWTKEAKKIWPNAEFVLFDGFDKVKFLYEEANATHHIGVLSDEDGKRVKFYQHPDTSSGNSYYREAKTDVYDKDMYVERTTATLDTVRASRKFPQPDLVKIDVQGAELDVINGALETLKNVKYLIVELQSEQYNEGAPKVDVSLPYIENLGWKCIAKKFSDNGPDADYCFVNTRLG